MPTASASPTCSTTDAQTSSSWRSNKRADQELVAQFLGLLTEREREVLVRRFGLDDGEPDTLEEIGESWGVTRERIRQIESQALKRLAESGLAARERATR